MLPVAELGFSSVFKEKELVIIAGGNKSDRIALHAFYEDGDLFDHKRTRKCDYFLPTLESLCFYLDFIII